MKKNAATLAIALILCHFPASGSSASDGFQPEKPLDVNQISHSNQYSDATVARDVIYKITNEKELTLDIYKPLVQVYQKSPAIVYIHGGAWVMGNKNGTDTKSLMPYFNTLRQNGYTIITINYRLLSDGSAFPGPISDCKDALRWIVQNSDSYSIDSNNIGLWGVSSGANMAMLCAYSSANEFKDEASLSSQSTAVRYVIDFSGPTSFEGYLRNTPVAFRKYISAFSLDKKISSSPTPLQYIKSTSPPTLIVHGKNDKIVPYYHSKNLYETALSRGANAKYILINGADHTLSGASASDISMLSESIFKFIYENYNH